MFDVLIVGIHEMIYMCTVYLMLSLAGVIIISSRTGIEKTMVQVSGGSWRLAAFMG